MAKPNPKRLEALLAIGELLAPKAKSLPTHVTQAFHDPAAYLAAHAKRMDDRGIDEPVEELAWIALIDALTAAKVLVEIDWKTDAENVEWAVKKLHTAFRWTKAEEAELEERSTWELLEIAGAVLRKKQLQLAHLDIGSDSFCLVVVPAKSFAELARLSRSARYGAAEAFGSDLAKATRERVARMKRDAREVAREAARERPPWDFYRKGDEWWCIQVHKMAFDTGFEAPGVKRYVNHYFSSPAETTAAAKRQVAAWRAAGFAKLTKAQADALPSQGDGAYLGWVGPFPEDARYYLEGKTIVRCIALRGDAVMSTSGVVGKCFGELENHRHAKAAEKRFAEELERYAKTSFYKPIARDALMALYGKGERPRGATSGARPRRARPASR